mgnify:CR=1 FL=1
MVGRDESPASVLDGTADAQILLHDKTHWNQRPGVPHCISILWQSSMAVSNVRASSIRRIASSEAVAGTFQMPSIRTPCLLGIPSRLLFGDEYLCGQTLISRLGRFLFRANFALQIQFRVFLNDLRDSQSMPEDLHVGRSLRSNARAASRLLQKGAEATENQTARTNGLAGTTDLSTVVDAHCHEPPDYLAGATNSPLHAATPSNSQSARRGAQEIFDRFRVAPACLGSRDE